MWCTPSPPTELDLEFRKGVPPSRFLEWLTLWDLSIICKDAVAKKHIPVKSAQAVTQEYKYFLALVGGRPDLPIPASGMVDTFWHHHLLFTHNYDKMCSKVFRRFIHHEPAILVDDPTKRYLTTDELDDLFKAELGVERSQSLW